MRTILPDGVNGAAARAPREKSYAVAELDGRGREAPGDVLDAVVSRKEVLRMIDTVEARVPRPFLTVEELRTTHRDTPRP